MRLFKIAPPDYEGFKNGKGKKTIGFGFYITPFDWEFKFHHFTIENGFCRNHYAVFLGPFTIGIGVYTPEESKR